MNERWPHLADIAPGNLGPRRVMWIGLGIWAVFEVLFLTVALATDNYVLMLIFYGIRGLGYPLFEPGPCPFSSRC
jgi:Na+/melibiose symporter-like transporter